MTKKIIFIAVLTIVLIGIFVFGKAGLEEKPVVENPKTEISKITIVPTAPSMTVPLSNNPRDIAWNLFQKYLEFNKNRDLDGVRSVVYKLAPVCEDPKMRIDCESRMGSAHAYGKELRKESFTNIWSDDKQMILSSDFWIEDSDDMGLIGRFRSIIFFVKDPSGNWKILSWSPNKGGATSKGEAGNEELMSRILIWTEDKDEDGISDYSEECLDKPNDENCVKTDPKRRDSDNDGWWDGIEVYF